MAGASDSEWEASGSGEEEEVSAKTGSDSEEEQEVQGEEEEEEEDKEPSAQELEERRQANVKALLSGRPLLPRLLSVQDAEAVLKQPFRSPHPNAAAGPSEALKRKLLARRQFVPWGNASFVPLKLSSPKPPLADQQAPPAPDKVELPPGVEPLVLWAPPPGEVEGAGAGGAAVVVDDMLTRWLRPHQREGVQFMFECVCGLRKFEGQGCILADDMGLGKTLQGITLLWTLLNSGHALLGGSPVARRVIICCPTSLVSNWDSECAKWLQGRVRTLPLCESSRDDVISSISQFLSPRNYFQVLIVSYETFRLHADRFSKSDSCDLLICDEAHRLKNDQTLTNKALGSLACKRRVLLSGTPLQNHLDEFFAMVSFCNPGVLGSPSQFRKHFELPILAGREPGASEEEVRLGAERSAELSAIVNEFILRRTNSLLSAHLPPKVIEVVCCRMTPLQCEMYCHFLQSKATRSLFSSQKTARVLSLITSLRKLLNHPKLIYDSLHSNAHADEGGAQGFEDCGRFFPPGMFDAGRAGRGGMMIGWELLSGKFAVLARMLEILRASTKERIVIVSNFTQTLDLVAQLCREKNYPFLRLDGSTSISKRQKLVKRFNDPADNQFVFLLSSKAGGCGLNLIGGSRLLLFDCDWNPANDAQAAGRVWRDGQRRRVFVYRFLTTGTIEEKVFQRQLSKKGLQEVVNSKGGSSGPNLMSMEELRDLFSFDPPTLSSTYESVCKDSHGGGDGEGEQHQEEQEQGEGGSGGDMAAPAIFKPQAGKPAEEDLQNWGHHSTVNTVPDPVMQQIGGEHISFLFSCQVEGKPLEQELSQGQQNGGAAAPTTAPHKQAPGRGPRSGAASACGGSRLQPPSAQQQQQPQQQLPQQQQMCHSAGSRQPVPQHPPAQQQQVPRPRLGAAAAAPIAGGNGSSLSLQLCSAANQPPEQQQQQQQQLQAAVPQGQQEGPLLRGPSAERPLMVPAPCSAATAPVAAGGSGGGQAEPGGSAVLQPVQAPGRGAAHEGKENAASDACRAAAGTLSQQGEKPAGRSLLSLPKRPFASAHKPGPSTGLPAQQTASSLIQQKRKPEEACTAASKRAICISDSDDDFQ